MTDGSTSSDVDGVIITGDLDRRPSRAPDYQAEAQALNALVEAMSTNPGAVLQRLVEVAMELTRSDSAGISLLELGGENGTFRCVATAGTWSPFRDGTMPREASPCGEVIAREAVLLMKNPERSFPALLQAEPGISEALLAPFHLGGVPVGTVWTIKHSPDDHFEAEDARLVKSLARFASAAHQTVQALQLAEAAGQRADVRFQQLVTLAEVSSEFFGTCDMEFMPVYGNAAAMRMVGLADLEQVKRTPLQEFFFPEDLPFIIDEFLPRVLREGQAKVEIRFRHFMTGEPVWVEYSVVALKDETGRATGLGTVTHDLTERKRTEAMLRASEERQAFLLKLSDALTPLGDAVEIERTATKLLGEALNANRAFYAAIEADGDTGVIRADYVSGGVSAAGRFSIRTFGPSFVADWLAGRTTMANDVNANPLYTDAERVAFAVVSGQATITVPLVKRGSLVAIMAVNHATPRKWTDGEIERVSETANRIWDASQRAVAEQELRNSEARFRQFSDASTDALWIRDAGTLEIMFASPAFDAIYGIPGPERGGDPSLRSWVRLIEPENRKTVLANFRRVRAGERIEQEFRIKRATDGALRWIHNTDFPLRDAAGVVRWLAGLGADTTTVREATDRQGLLVAELQHRTRNLIAVVRSLCDRTLGNAVSLEDFDQRFRLRLSALSRVQGLLSHLAVGEKVTFQELLCSELDAHGASNGKSHKVTLDGPADVLLRSATVQIFALALHELATNAAKYGALQSPDGHLFVSWRVEPASGGDPPRLRVEWRESGVAMPKAGAPARGGGYGRELIERALPYQLKAKTTYEMGLDGVRCTIAVPLTGGRGVGGGASSRE